MTHAEYLCALLQTYFGCLLVKKIEPRQWSAYIHYYQRVTGDPLI